MPGRVAPGTSHSFKALRDLESALMLRDQPRLLTSGGHSPDRDVWEEKKLGEGEVTPRGLRRGRIEEERDGDGVGSMRNEEGDNLSGVWQQCAAKPNLAAFPIPTGSCHRRLIITRSQVLPGTWTEPGHLAGMGSGSYTTLPRDPRAGDQCATRRRGLTLHFSLPGLGVEVFGLGEGVQLLSQLGAPRPSRAPYSKATPPPSKQHAQ